ncbi:MAG: monofunctional biosynthetic peptidoglycan transglycosylase [Gammaproteobacteria bacterium RIFCSPHIGHO2_12_FULL_63_22]|nr:MAG: monofunctional biosynthetic peptidoglycan transglycosylase [Gammaproteobacteria bacterium RIFCSPHIGHO2_12_FULL_63_22]
MAAAAGKRPRGWKRIARWIFLWLPLWFLLLTTAQVLLLRWIPPVTSAFMVSRRVDAMVQRDWDFQLRYTWRSSRDISRNLPIALVAAEDQTFPDHHGFDFKAIDKAMKNNQRGRKVRGASTISQQVAKNLFLWKGRSYVRKGLEAWYTVLIEVLWPKQRILEVYANIAEFGDGVYGAEAAARTYFGKPASKLTPSESARMAAVLPSPRRYSVAKPGPYVQRRARWIERQVRHLGGPAYLIER